MVEDYLKNAKENEIIFRNILDEFGIKNKENSLDEIYKKYSLGDRNGIFTILNFKTGPQEETLEKISAGEAIFSSQNISFLSGFGATRKYKINKDSSVEYIENTNVWMS